MKPTPEYDTSDVARGASLFDQLPAYYQENAGALGELVRVAEDLLAVARDCWPRLQEGGGDRREWRATRWSALFDRSTKTVPGLSSRVAGAVLSNDVMRAAGTGLGIERWLLGGEFGGMPLPRAIWHGASARVREGGLLEFRYSSGPAAILLWGEELPEPPADFFLPDAILPAGVPIQAVRLAKVKSTRRPPDRARLPGTVFWERGGSDGIQKPRAE